MTDRGSGNSQFGSVDCHDIHEHAALCPATYPPSKKKEKCDSKSISFAQMVRQPQRSTGSRKKKGALLTVCWLTPLHAASWLSIVTGADTAISATKLILTPPLKRRRRPQITQKSPF
jgi:hypothetical protein